MSSPIPIQRPATASESSSSVSTSVGSTSSTGSARKFNQGRYIYEILILDAGPFIYTRHELLALATSPLSHGPAPAAVAAFPEIMRRTRRGVMEAYQALDYERKTQSGQIPSLKPDWAQPRSSPSRAQQANLPLPMQLPPPVWKVDVYVPPARRIEQEQRVRPGRDVRVSRIWRRPVQARW